MKKKIIVIISLLILIAAEAIYLLIIGSGAADNLFFLALTEGDSSKKEFKSTVCALNTQTGSLKPLNELEQNSQNPIVFYRQNDNKIYYTNKSDEKEGADQLYEYDLNTKKKVRLTKELFGVSYIGSMTKDRLFITAAREGENAVLPFYYDIKKRKLVSMAWSKDFSINAVRMNPENEEIFISGYSSEKDYSMMEDFNSSDNPNPYGIDNKIYKLDEEGADPVFEIKGRYIDSFAIKGRTLVCMTSLRGLSPIVDGKFHIYDLNTRKELAVRKGISGNIFFLSDDYAYINTGKEIVKIRFSDFKKESIIKVKKDKEWINNVYPKHENIQR